MSHRTFAGDPYKQIPAALLNSADILAYANAGTAGTRLFEPFEAAKLKSASYAIRFHDADYYYWSPGNTARSEGRITTNQCLTVPKNGIVFVCPRIEFNVPDYLALRFNLAIRWVHRGLLLGTGPLVDPGFKGRLLIPVHNLTDTAVDLPADKDFIWIEVTKISPFPPAGNAHGASYVHFDPLKKDLDVGQYFEKANKGAPIRSSIPSVSEELESRAKALRTEFEKFDLTQSSRINKIESNVNRLQIAGYIALVITVLSMVIGVYQIAESTKALVFANQQSLDSGALRATDELRRVSDKVSALEARMQSVAASQPAAKKVSQKP